MRFDEHYFIEKDCLMTDEMKDYFKKRTNKHISLVQKYCKKIDDLGMAGLEDIVDRGNVHDASKFKEPEYTPYVFLSWDYKCKDDGVDSGFSQEIKDQMNTASNHHVKNNSHHVESHTDQTDVINREDRDKPPEDLIDGTSMGDLDIAEMCADWCAMSEERGNSPHSWAKNNVNVRWKFTDDQTKLIYNLLDRIWEA